MDRNEALYKLGCDIREAIDEAFDNGGLSLTDIVTEIRYQADQASDSGDYDER